MFFQLSIISFADTYNGKIPKVFHNFWESLFVNYTLQKLIIGIVCVDDKTI